MAQPRRNPAKLAHSVRKHPAERFINWFPHHTKLYLRGEQGKPWEVTHRLYEELFEQLKQFFDVEMHKGVSHTSNEAVLEEAIAKYLPLAVREGRMTDEEARKHAANIMVLVRHTLPATRTHPHQTRPT